MPKWDDDGHFLFGPAVRRSVFPSFCHVRVFSLDPLQGYLRAEFDEKTTHCGAKRGSMRPFEIVLTPLTLNRIVISVVVLTTEIIYTSAAVWPAEGARHHFIKSFLAFIDREKLG